MQVKELFLEFDELHKLHGSKELTSIYGAGEINRPDICLVFMNPTAKNVALSLNWRGIKAPWIGTKNVWRLLSKLGLFNNKSLMQEIETLKPEEWSFEFAEDVYSQVAKDSMYITNIAKCTQSDAKHLPDSIYKEYLPLLLRELIYIKPKLVLALGNQVNSVILGKPISVSKYQDDEFEELIIGGDYKLKLYPSYYPVGQGMRNMHKAISRIQKVISISRSS